MMFDCTDFDPHVTMSCTCGANLLYDDDEGEWICSACDKRWVSVEGGLDEVLRGPCSVCGDMCSLACSDCAVQGLGTVHVCRKATCRDVHDQADIVMSHEIPFNPLMQRDVTCFKPFMPYCSVCHDEIKQGKEPCGHVKDPTMGEVRFLYASMDPGPKCPRCGTGLQGSGDGWNWICRNPDCVDFMVRVAPDEVGHVYPARLVTP